MNICFTFQDSASILEEEVVEEGWDDGFRGIRNEVRTQPVPLSQASTGELTAIEKEMEIWNQVIQGPKKEEVDIDILAFWRKHQATLPLLSWLARRVLCIPASSAASERAFSTGGKVVSPSRTLLNGEMAEDLIWIQKNFDVLDPLVSKYTLRMSEYRKLDKARQKEAKDAGKEKEKEKEKTDVDESSSDKSGSDTDLSEARYDSDAVISIHDSDYD